jgi:adenylosuccinate synthase
VGTDRLVIDPRAMIIDPDDVAFEKKHLEGSIGSTAQGVGAASSRKILRSAASPAVQLAKDIAQLKPFVGETLEVLERAFAQGKRVFVEGTQGTHVARDVGKRLPCRSVRCPNSCQANNHCRP